MIDNLAKYVYEVYRSKSVSAAAKKLYISQPALSASIKKAEKQLGVPIFNRKTVPFTLTPEGKVYISAIEKLMRIEEETSEQIRDISQLKKGTVKIATSTHVSYYAIPKICERFRKIYPNVDISIIPTDTDKLVDMLEKQVVDLVFIYTDTGLDDVVTKPLFEEKFSVAIRKDYPGAEELIKHALSYNELVECCYPAEKAIDDMALFHGIEFIYSPPNSNIYKKRKLVFAESEIETHITSSIGRQLLDYNLMYSGFGALFTTDAVIATMPEYEECMYFALGNPQARRNFSMCFRKNDDSPSAKIVHEFANVAKELFSMENPISVLRMQA